MNSILSGRVAHFVLPTSSIVWSFYLDARNFHPRALSVSLKTNQQTLVLHTTHAGFFSNQISLPLPSTTFRNLIDWHTLSSKSVDFRFPNNGSNSTQNTSSINNRSTPWDPHAEIQLISGGSFGEVYSARRNEPWKFLQNVGLLNTLGGCMNCEIHELTTGCCLVGFFIYIYWICEGFYNIFTHNTS